MRLRHKGDGSEQLQPPIGLIFVCERRGRARIGRICAAQAGAQLLGTPDAANSRAWLAQQRAEGEQSSLVHCNAVYLTRNLLYFVSSNTPAQEGGFHGGATGRVTVMRLRLPAADAQTGALPSMRLSSIRICAHIQYIP